MTTLKYIMASGICTTAEVLKLKREHPADFDVLVKWAEEEMKVNDITVDAPTKA